MNSKTEQIEQLNNLIKNIVIRETPLSFHGRPILQSDPIWSGVRINRIASLGSELIFTKEQIKLFSSKSKKNLDCQIALAKLLNRLSEINKELNELDATVDSDGWVQSH